jgi:hypothetical protein
MSVDIAVIAVAAPSVITQPVEPIRSARGGGAGSCAAALTPRP